MLTHLNQLLTQLQVYLLLCNCYLPRQKCSCCPANSTQPCQPLIFCRQPETHESETCAKYEEHPCLPAHMPKLCTSCRLRLAAAALQIAHSHVSPSSFAGSQKHMSLRRVLSCSLIRCRALGQCHLAHSSAAVI